MIETQILNTPIQNMWPVKQSLPTGNTFIRIRESLLNWLSGASSEQVVNNMDTTAPELSGTNLAIQMKEALSRLKAAAMDDGGTAVNYKTLRNNPDYLAYQNTYLAALRHFDPGSLSEREARAFWLNLYNALVIDAVLAFDVQSSITEGFLGIVAFFRRAAYVVGGQRVALEDMEHGILRGNQGQSIHSRRTLCDR